jgi:spore coat protein H
VGRSYYYRLVAQDLFCNDAPGTLVGPVTIIDHDNSNLPVFELALSDAALEGLTRDVSVDLYVPAILYIDGSAYEVEVRNRGASTRYLSKQNFKIRLKGGATHEGRNGFKLNSEVVDPQLITERLAYDLFEQVGALAPRARYVHLVLAGRYLGVYTEIQEVDRLFFAGNGIDDGGNLYRLGGGLLNILDEQGAYAEIYEKKTNESDPAGHADLIDFVEQLNRTPAHLFAGWADERFAADEYLDFLAVNLAVANHDMIDGNQYVYHDTALDQWHHVPWDYNNGTFADPWSSPLVLTLYESGLANPWWFSSLTRFFGDGELRSRLRARLEELLGGALAPDAIEERAATLVARAATDVALDPWMVAWERDQGYADDVVPGIGEFAAARHAFLQEALVGLATLHGPLVINEYQAVNTGEVVDEHGDADPWIELYNRGEETVVLSGLCLTPDLRDPDAAHCFGEPIQVPPGELLLLWADGEPEQGELHLGFTLDADGGELGLLPFGEGEDDWKLGEAGVHDVTFYGAQNPGESYGRLEHGSEEWGPIASPTPGE